MEFLGAFYCLPKKISKVPKTAKIVLEKKQCCFLILHLQNGGIDISVIFLPQKSPINRSKNKKIVKQIKSDT